MIYFCDGWAPDDMIILQFYESARRAWMLYQTTDHNTMDCGIRSFTGQTGCVFHIWAKEDCIYRPYLEQTWPAFILTEQEAKDQEKLSNIYSVKILKYLECLMFSVSSLHL